MIKTGGAANPPDRAGLADLTAHMLDEGTKTRSALAIADQVAALGATLSTGSTWDASNVSLSTLSRNLDAGAGRVRRRHREPGLRRQGVRGIPGAARRSVRAERPRPRRRWPARRASWSPRRACARSESARPARSGGLAAPPVLIIRLKSTSGRSWNSARITSRPFLSLKRFGRGGLKVGSGPGGGASWRNGASGVSRPGDGPGAVAARGARGGRGTAATRPGAGGGRGRGGGRRGRAAERRAPAPSARRADSVDGRRPSWLHPSHDRRLRIGLDGHDHARVLLQVLLRGALDGGGVDGAVAAQVFGEEAGIADQVGCSDCRRSARASRLSRLRTVSDSIWFLARSSSAASTRLGLQRWRSPRRSPPGSRPACGRASARR